MVRRLGPSSLVLLLFVAACGGGTAWMTSSTEAQGSSLLVGRVTRWPAGPVQGMPGTAGSPGAAGVQIVLTGLDGRVVGSSTTDARGEYRLSAPAGTYQITVAALRPLESVKDLPARVTLQPGIETRLDILIDTG